MMTGEIRTAVDVPLSSVRSTPRDGRTTYPVEVYELVDDTDGLTKVSLNLRVGLPGDDLFVTLSVSNGRPVLQLLSGNDVATMTGDEIVETVRKLAEAQATALASVAAKKKK